MTTTHEARSTERSLKHTADRSQNQDPDHVTDDMLQIIVTDHMLQRLLLVAQINYTATTPVSSVTTKQPTRLGSVLSAQCSLMTDDCSLMTAHCSLLTDHDCSYE